MATSFNSQNDKHIVDEYFKDIISILKQFSPEAKIEDEKTYQENSLKEKALFKEQQQLHQLPEFQVILNYLHKDLKEIKSLIKVYFMYAWPDKHFETREAGVQTFLTTLHQHLNTIGIKAILDKEDNFTGSNLNQFMAQLGESNFVLLFGTESFRYKWHKDNHTFEQIPLKLKYLNDLIEGTISQSKTAIIPYVLTGIRQTVFPDELFPNHNITISAWRINGYLKTFINIVAILYNVDKKYIEKYFSSLQEKMFLSESKLSMKEEISANQGQPEYLPLSNNNAQSLPSIQVNMSFFGNSSHVQGSNISGTHMVGPTFNFGTMPPHPK